MSIEGGIILEQEEQEIVAAEITLETDGNKLRTLNVDDELNRVNRELERYISKADRADYAFAIFSGILAGAIDAMYVGEIRFTKKEFGLSHRQVNNFIQDYAKARGLKHDRLKDAVGDLEKTFKVVQDAVWKGKNIGVSAKNHHLADLAHHPTPLGLAFAIIAQFLRIGTFINKEGEWHFVFAGELRDGLMELFVPAVITGVLNWLVGVAKKEYSETTGKDMPEVLSKLSHLIAQTPILIEIAGCADNWFGHLVSDMGGSKKTAGKGMGIPGVFISLLQELSGLPVMKNSGLPAFVNDLYVNQKWDLRHELTFASAAGKQAVPVVLNEILVRTGYFVRRLALEIKEHKGLEKVDWSKVIPIGNRTVERMLTVASLTFTAADTTDAAERAALESGGSWVVFAGRFAARFNYIGAGRAVVAIVKEISGEQKEQQLLREKRILTEAKTAFTLQQLEEYKTRLEETIAGFIAEDIEVFITGFDFMHQGLATGDSDLVIKGNVVIQRVLGRKPQFTSQDEFDALMDDSDTPLIF